MNETEVLTMFSGYGVCASTFVLCFLGGIVPVISTEVVLLGVSSVVTPSLLLPMALVATLGQMLAKALCYYSGQGLLRFSPARCEQGLQQLEVRLARWEKSTDLLIFVSALSGVPPFYLLPFVAGSLRLHFGRFFLSGFVGRFLRFGCVLAGPQLVKQIW